MTAPVPDLERRRVEACRLDPRLALDTLDDAVAFLHDRGMLTLTPCCALPSLFGACHEEPHSPGVRGFGQYPKTRWWWGGALAGTDGVTDTKLHAGRTLFLTPRLVDVVAPLCVDAVARAADGALGDDAARVVALLRSAGPTTTDELKEEAGLDARRYQRVRSVLEKHGAVLTRSITVDAAHGDGHRHLSELRLWPHEPAGGATTDEALVGLLVAAVASAVVLPVADATKAFTWRIPKETVARALDAGAVVAPAAGLLAAA